MDYLPYQNYNTQTFNKRLIDLDQYHTLGPLDALPSVNISALSEPHAYFVALALSVLIEYTCIDYGRSGYREGESNVGGFSL